VGERGCVCAGWLAGCLFPLLAFFFATPSTVEGRVRRIIPYFAGICLLPSCSIAPYRVFSLPPSLLSASSLFYPFFALSCGCFPPFIDRVQHFPPPSRNPSIPQSPYTYCTAVRSVVTLCSLSLFRYRLLVHSFGPIPLSCSHSCISRLCCFFFQSRERHTRPASLGFFLLNSAVIPSIARCLSLIRPFKDTPWEKRERDRSTRCKTYHILP
jgi:hypothetical protein